MDKDKGVISSRVGAVRIRAWGVTIVIIIFLIFYILVRLITKEIDIIKFIITSFIQIAIYISFFPEGEIYGQRDVAFVKNKTIYNQKASSINELQKIGKLREYCEVDYLRRKLEYITIACDKVGISINELEVLKSIDKNKLKDLACYTFERNGKSAVIYFTRSQAKAIYNLIYKRIPIKKNKAETIMSAVEGNGTGIITDGSITFRRSRYIRRIFNSLIVGFILAIIGYTLKNGVGVGEIFELTAYLTTIITTGVWAYTAGETNMKVYKNAFYVQLINFIDGFFEWDKTKLEK